MSFKMFIEIHYLVILLSTLQNVHFGLYDGPVVKMALYPIQSDEGVDTGAYFKENHGFRVWNSRFLH